MERALEARRIAPGRGRSVVGGLTAVALVALAFTFAFALAFSHAEPAGGDTLHPVEAVHDGAVALIHDVGLETSSLHGYRAEPASRTRATAFAILAVGVVVAATARRRRRVGPRPVLRVCRRTGPAPGRGPPSLRIV